MIGRRQAIGGFAALALASPAIAQGRRMRVGIAVSDSVPAYVETFRRELERLGGSGPGGFEIRIADGAGDPARLPRVVAELLAWQPDVIISSSNRTHFAVRDATSIIPVVLVAAIDPVQLGVSESISRPTRNFTGSLGFVDGLMQKRVELLREVLPAAGRIALHLDPGNPAFPATQQGAVIAGRQMGLEIVIAGYGHRADVVPALDKAKTLGAQAVIVLPDGIAISQMDAIAARATELGLPTLGLNDTDLRLGLTFVVGADRVLLWREAAATADKLLRGTKVSDIPFQQPTKVHVGVNLKVARTLGLNVPLAVIARADEVIE